MLMGSCLRETSVCGERKFCQHVAGAKLAKLEFHASYDQTVTGDIDTGAAERRGERSRIDNRHTAWPLPNPRPVRMTDYDDLRRRPVLLRESRCAGRRGLPRPKDSKNFL